MTKSTDLTAGLGTLVPGFDFLKSLAQGASAGGASKMPNLSSWVAPTLNVEDLDKRISELKTVHFWLDQNAKALAATIQALEVQKMTLATLKGLNFSVGELAEAFKIQVPDVSTPAKDPAASAAPVPAPAAPAAKKTRSGAKKTVAKGEGGAGVIDPSQWWNALGAQFQAIANSAVQDLGQLSAAAQGAGSGTPKAASKSGAKKRAVSGKGSSK